MQLVFNARVCVRGQVIDGGMLSTTVTVAVHELDLPELSYTVNVTVLFPRFEQLKVLG